MEACGATTDSKIHLELSREEALVFFEWLSRFNKAEDSKFGDQAEQRVLWDIEGQLESILVEPFEPNYDELLDETFGTEDPRCRLRALGVAVQR